ncbi:hypothetical protein Dimus_022590 [Dionaea muscipula]
MAPLNRPWYAAGLDICKLQVEDELVKAEQTRTISLDILDRLDPKNKGRYVFPEVKLFPEELISKTKLVKRAPLEKMKDLAMIEDAEMDLRAAASWMVPSSKHARVYLLGDGHVPHAEATSILFQSNMEDLQQAFPCPRRFKFMLLEEGRALRHFRHLDRKMAQI